MLKDSIRDCIAEYLSSASPSSAKSAAASRITSLCDPDDIEMFCWTCWSTFIDAAAIVPNHVTDEEQTERIYKLVHLVAAVRDAEPLRTEKGEIVTCWGKRCWNDLPLLGPSMREAWDRERDEDPAVWARKNAFAAILTAKNVSDFALYAIWTLREALEGDFPPSPPCPQSASIPAAAAWIQHAGRELIVREDDYGTAGQGGSLWAGKAGFSRERWTFWHTRLQEIATDGKLNERTRLEALRAGKALAELLLLPEGDEARHN